MIASGKREGMRIGEKKGKRVGQKQINLLNQKLLADGRNEELIRACSDMEFQEKLLKEYGLE